MADRIRVDTAYLGRWAGDLGNVSDALEDALSSLKRVDTGDDWWRKVKVNKTVRLADEKSSENLGNARSAVNTLESVLKRYQKSVDQLGAAVRQAGIDFEVTEENITSICNGTEPAGESVTYKDEDGAFISAGIEMISSWYEDAKEGIVDFGKSLLEIPGKLWGNIKDCAAFWMNDYKQRGTTYKVLQTGKAVLSIVGDVSMIALMWGGSSALTVGSGGVGAGTMVLAGISTGYKVNSIANSLTDIYNCWWGDVDQVGEVNYLKDNTVKLTGGIGEMLGNREAGENVGEIMYTGGQIASIFGDISAVKNFGSQVIQSPDLAKSLPKAGSEFKQGVEGLWDIATKSDISRVAYDLKLLEYSCPNLKEVSTTGKLIWDIGKTTKEVGEKAVSIIGDMVDTYFSFAY